MPYKLRRIHAVTNTFSGVLGEVRIAAELLRCGFKVAKPYWNDDEMDLLAFLTVGTQIVPIPIQVKSRQFMRGEGRTFISIKKAYVSRNMGLCLFLYYPAEDTMWLINGREAIIGAYNAQASWDANHTRYAKIKKGANVKFAFPKAETSFDSKWKIDTSDASDISRRLAAVAKKTLEHNKIVKGLEALWQS